MFFETSFSSFFVFLATENDVKIELFSLLFRKRRFCENHHETLAVRTKIKVRIWKKHKKSEKKIDAEITIEKNIEKNIEKIDFGLHFGSKNPPKIHQKSKKVASEDDLKKRVMGLNLRLLRLTAPHPARQAQEAS